MHNLNDNHICSSIFDIYLIVGFEVHEVNFLVMRIISILRKVQHVSNHVLINYIATTKFNISICYVHVGMLRDQQVHIIKSTRLNN